MSTIQYTSKPEIKRIANQLVRDFLTREGLSHDLMMYTEKDFDQHVNACESELSDMIHTFLTSEEGTASLLVNLIQQAEAKRELTHYSFRSFKMRHGVWVKEGNNTIGFYYLGSEIHETLNVFIVNGKVYEVFTKENEKKTALLYNVPKDFLTIPKIIEFFKDKEPGEIEIAKADSNHIYQLYDEIY